jgi:hypothetical protein
MIRVEFGYQHYAAAEKDQKHFDKPGQGTYSAIATNFVIEELIDQQCQCGYECNFSYDVVQFYRLV